MHYKLPEGTIKKVRQTVNIDNEEAGIFLYQVDQIAQTVKIDENIDSCIVL